MPRQLLLLLATALAAAIGVTAQQPYTLTYLPATRAEAGVLSQSATLQLGNESARVEREGSERTGCDGREQRRSTGKASAISRTDAQSENGIAFRLAVSAAANGGHFARYVSCIGGIGIGISGEDTSGSARSLAQGDVEIAFRPGIRPERYFLDLNLGLAGERVRTIVTDSAGSVLYSGEGNGASVPILGNPSARYRVSVLLEAAVHHSGATGTVERSGNLLARLTVRPSALIADSEGIVPRIVGGVPNSGFPSVGAILYGRKMHCTGTLVAPRTVLTAAHCLFGRLASDMTFLLGDSVNSTTSTVLTVTGLAYPRGENGFRYVHGGNYPDDIGVIYLAAPATPVTPLHDGNPALAVSPSQQLTFVGFGFALVDGVFTGLGVKRTVPMPLSQIFERTYRYSVPNANTCAGDSGGPAFLSLDGKDVVTGVTSYGDAGCTVYGVNTRVEAYLSWINPRLK